MFNFASHIAPRYTATLLVVFVLLLGGGARAQYFIYSEQKPDIESRFVRHNIETQARQTIFNALIIKNRANRPESITLNLSVPQGWNVVGADKIEITLAPLDSTIIPIRVGVGAQVRGNIGYNIIASIVDSKGTTIKNDYCFVKIPGKYDLRYSIVGGMSYFDPVDNTSRFGVNVQNRGNREETVSFLLNGNKQMGIGPKEQNIYAQDIILPPYSDTTLTFNVARTHDNAQGRNMFPLNFTIQTTDSALSRQIWFRSLDSKLVNEISTSNRPLSVELNIQGLLDEYARPTFSATIQGRTLFPGSSDVYYYYRNHGSSSYSDLYYKSRLHVGANLGRWNLEYGDNTRSMEGNMYGRGFYGTYKGTKMQYTLLANKDINTDMVNAGVSGSWLIGKTILTAGANYNQQPSTNFKSIMGYMGSSFTLFKKHQFRALASYNRLDRLIDGQQKHNAFGAELNYTSQLGPSQNNLRAEYHSPLFHSYKAGRSDIVATSYWTLNDRNRLHFTASDFGTQRHNISGSSTTSSNNSRNGEARVEHLYQLTKGAGLFWGPMVRRQLYQSSNPMYIPGRDLFRSVSEGLAVGARISIAEGSIFISPRAEFAITQNLNNPFPSDTSSSRKLYNRSNYQFFSLNIRSSSFGLIAMFSMGPRNVNEQINHANRLINSKRLIFIPSYNRDIYRDIVNLNLTWSYNNDLISKFTYSSLSAQVSCRLPKEWFIGALAQYNTQTRTRSTENFETFQNFYAEITVRKDFDIQQPRVKYHNVDMVFFKDFNGNFHREDNEPGIKNVLVEIEKVSSNVKGEIPHDLSSAELLSDNMGRVRFENLPEGVYNVKYNPLGNEAGSYSKGREDVQLVVNKSGDYFFPFVEKNKMFGKIILNRSKLSGLGNIDVSNIRITSTDSRGNMFSTLTDKNGEFVLFAPSTDEYVVNVNNIFYENFDLRQNSFRVQFNGYKQFEVNFVFDEKVRRINFAQTLHLGEDGTTGVIQIRRTNVQGTVKDETSLKPIRARVNLVNTTNNSVVASVYSNSQDGSYGLSFIADDKYVVEVLADSYWYHSENLALNQVTTFMNVTKDVLLRQIAVGSTLELNARFAINSAVLMPETVAELNRLMRVLRANSTIKIEIQGHCDDVENIDHPNIAEERAKAIARYIIEHGFTNVSFKSMGNTKPAVVGNTEENRMLNRRVEVVVMGK